MALSFTYRLTAETPQGEAPAPHLASVGHLPAAPHGSGDPVDPWSPDPDVALQLTVGPPPDLLGHGAIGTMPADPAQRPESGLGFSCLDLLAGCLESGP